MTYTIEDYAWVYGHKGSDEYLLELELRDKESKERYTDNIFSENALEYVLASGKFYEWCDGERVLPAEYFK